MENEQVMFGVKKGNQDWQEELITNNPAVFDKARKWAEENGFDRIRIATIDLSGPPDFTKTLNIRRRR